MIVTNIPPPHHVASGSDPDVTTRGDAVQQRTAGPASAVPSLKLLRRETNGTGL